LYFSAVLVAVIGGRGEGGVKYTVQNTSESVIEFDFKKQYSVIFL
jgi:hypothetical protein